MVSAAARGFALHLMRGFAPLKAPDHKIGLQVFVTENDLCEAVLRYVGRREDLIAAGAGTAELVAKGRKGERRVDSDGDRVGITTFPNYVKLIRYKSMSDALALPGVTQELLDEAVQEARTRREEHESWLRESVHGAANMAPADMETLSGIAVGMAGAEVSMFVRGTKNGSLEDDARALRLMRELVELARTREGAKDVLQASMAQDLSLTDLVVSMRRLPPWGTGPARTRCAGRTLLHLVVDNTRQDRA